MFRRAIVIWCALLLCAVANGSVRVAWIIPRVGDYWGHVVSTLTLSAAILLIVWASIGWLAPSSAVDALRIGALWVAMTVAFEFLAGHYLFGSPWERLLADYNVLDGRTWVLVLLTTFVAPAALRRSRS